MFTYSNIDKYGHNVLLQVDCVKNESIHISVRNATQSAVLTSVFLNTIVEKKIV